MAFPVPGIPNATPEFSDLSARLTVIDQLPFAFGELSDVFRARKGQTKNLFVIKCLRAGQSINPNFEEELQQKLLQWGDISATLSHKNVSPWCGIAYGVSRLPGVVMEYHKGGSIVKRMSGHSYSNEEKVSWVKQIASGLRYLHRRRVPIVHGDLRGSNIYLNSSGNIVISDIGVAYITDSPEFAALRSTATAGRWTAPELMVAPRQSAPSEGPGFTIESDVFAFAMTVIQIFTEDVPFPNINSDVTCMLHILRGDRPELPQYLRDHTVLAGPVSDCWARDPSKRPSSTEICWRLGMGSSS